MSTGLDDIVAILDEMASEATSVCSYAAGLSDGLKTASMVIKKKSPDLVMEPTFKDTDQYRTTRQKTQGPVLDVLRTHGALTVTEIIRLARTEGNDLLRPTVQAALTRLERRGLVSNRGHRYTLTSFEK